LGISRNVNLAEEAVQVEKANDLVELIPDLLFESAEWIVLVVADGQRSGLFDGLNGVRRELNGLIEPDEVGFLLKNCAQQIAIDAADDEIKRG
jgi:hypothetical protein